MRETGRNRRLSTDPCAFKQHRQCRFYSDQARQPLGSAAARKQANERLGQAEGRLRMIGEHSVNLHLHADVDVPLHVTIVAEE